MLAFDELTRCDNSSRNLIFAYNTPNLGDYVQMLAIMQHVPFRGFIMRDAPLPARDMSLIANGWMTHGPFPRKDWYQTVKYVGIHIDPSLRTEDTLSQLRTGSPVGCRDTSTLRYLHANHVDSVLCRCPTVTFPRYTGPRQGIVCVDVPENIVARVRYMFGTLGQLKRSTHDVSWLDADCVTSGALTTRLKQAYDALMMYRSAALVVTSKVHCAVPAIAFGTPVVYVGPRDDRFGIFDGFEPQDWHLFSWYRAFNPFQRRTPPALDAEWAKTTYLAFLDRVLTGDASPRAAVVDQA